MSLYNYVIIVILTYYTFYFFRLCIKRNRIIIQQTNQKIDKLRLIKLKTMKQHKKFINLKYPKQPKFTFAWNKVLQVLLILAISFCVFFLFIKLFALLNINAPLWVAILFVFVFPILMNIVLKKFNLQQDDISVFFK
jgi:hypothetical protein